MRLQICIAFLSLLILRVDGGYLSITDFGAVANDDGDDTEAFEKAIAAASAHRATVKVPLGSYRIEKILSVPGIVIEGESSGAWGADLVVLPEIVLSGEKGGLRLGAGGAVSGIQFTHDWQGTPPCERPPTIELAGTGTRISQVKIAEPWVAIFADPQANVGRSMIESVFIVNAHHIGVALAGTYDVTWIRDVEVWSPGSKRFPVSGTGMLLGKNDMLLMRDCFVFGAAVGYHFTDRYPGAGEMSNGTWGSLSACNSDFSGTGILIEGEHFLTLNGGSHWCHGSSLWIKSGNSQVSVAGMELRANAAPALNIEGGKLMTISGSRLRGAHPNFSVPAAKITGDASVTISGSILSAYGDVIDSLKHQGDLILQGNIVQIETIP